MTGCSSLGCKNRSEDGYQLFVFPSNIERRKEWLKNIQRENLTCVNGRLCEEHFERIMFENHRKDGKRRLRWNAVPTIFNHSKPPKPSSSSPPLTPEDINCANTLLSLRSTEEESRYFTIWITEPPQQHPLDLREKSLKK